MLRGSNAPSEYTAAREPCSKRQTWSTPTWNTPHTTHHTQHSTHNTQHTAHAEHGVSPFRVWPARARLSAGGISLTRLQLPT